MEFLRKGVLTKRQTVNGQGQELVTTELNPDHPLVQEALPNYRERYEEEARTRLGLPADEELDEDELYADQYDDDDYDGDEEELEAETDVVLPGVVAGGGHGDKFEPDHDLDDDNRGNLIQPESSRFSRTATRTRPR